jgi:5-amino-6-(5-phosphoribosylamino)uracil reductase/diaminohydroxyphosphoribosylaminopyrimidine deaminase/5-amino-6-(5-phosphoribosylamino)uracil reductase
MSVDPRPLVTIHFAQTLDGRIAREGARTLLSSQEGIVRAHRARAEHDAVLIGARTLAIDDPLLTVRMCAGRQPRRIVLASALAIPAGARMMQPETMRGGGSIIAIGAEGRASPEAREALEARGVHALIVPATARGWVSLPHALSALAALGIERLLVEGGAAVLTSFLREQLADRVAIEIAPQLLGGSAVASLGALGGVAPVHLTDVALERVGANMLVRGGLVYAA